MTEITRRGFLSSAASIPLGLDVLRSREGLAFSPHATPALDNPAPSALPGTAPLTMSGDLAAQMVDGIHRFLLHRTEEAARERAGLWQRNYHSAEDYDRSVAPNRERFRQIIGAVDVRVPARPPELVGTVSEPALVSEANGYSVYAVRWAVFDPVIAGYGGLEAEGLFLEPRRPAAARVLAIPDADWAPEALVGLAPGVPPAAQFARRLAENGCQVLIPLLINREDTFSGVPGVGLTNQPHREWIYRMAFEVGRHIIGYEVQKVLAAIDWFASRSALRPAPLGVIGYGEGGLLALASAALDVRISATVVSGYFQAREGLWQEPIYRDVWGLVREFGDAELASFVAPRALIIEASQGPEVAGPPPATGGRLATACPNGQLATPPLDSVRAEAARARAFFAGLGAEQNLQLVVSGEGRGLPGSEAALEALLHALGGSRPLRPAGEPPRDLRASFDPQARLRRQFDQLVDFTQALIQKAPERRAAFWSRADRSSLERWKESTRFYRDYIWEEVIGRLPAPSLSPNPRTRLIFDQPKFRGYEVVLDVWPEVFAYGILLVPKNLKPGERRPVVVCQHGLEGRPREVADPAVDSPYYHRFAARLAEEGFVTYAPQNPYIGEDRFRLIQRLGHPLKLALFSFILGQHQRALDWLAEQPFVDGQRMGFYGLSYGGKTAVRVPPFLDRYALSICSGDFNEWVWKTTSLGTRYSYMYHNEYDMYEFNIANVVNYGELANLMAPRPFMVERGHRDEVGLDEWIAFEYAKVRRFYDQAGIGERTALEFFDGPHTIHGVGTFEFLRRHLGLAASGGRDAEAAQR